MININGEWRSLSDRHKMKFNQAMFDVGGVGGGGAADARRYKEEEDNANASKTFQQQLDQATKINTDGTNWSWWNNRNMLFTGSNNDSYYSGSGGADVEKLFTGNFDEAVTRAAVLKLGGDPNDATQRQQLDKQVRELRGKVWQQYGIYSDNEKDDKDNRNMLITGGNDALQKFILDKTGLDIQAGFDSMGMKTGENSGLSQNIVDAVSGKSSLEIAQQGIKDVMNMGQAFMQSQLASANDDIYNKRQQMLEAQRKYGITGAVANAQAQDFELKSRQQLANISNQSAMQWYQTAGAELKYYRQMESDQKLETIRGVASKIADKSMDQETAFKSLSAMDPNITREDVASAFKDRIKLDSLMKGLQGGVTPVKSTT